MKTIRKVLVLLSTALVISSCTQDEIIDKNVASLEFNNQTIEVDPTGSDVVNLVFYTTFTPSSDLNIPISVVETSLDESQYSFPENITLPAGTNKGEFEMTLTDVSFFGEPFITMAFDDNGGLRTEFVLECSEPNVIVNIVFDQYSEETSWEIINDTGDVLFNNSYDAGSTSTEEGFCLPSGDYDFFIYDAYGDGICCDFGEGSYQLTFGDGTVIAEGGQFTDSESVSFTIE
ncbi:hypothetical protein [Psychroflexus planctonicus]|uniref:DUF4382 domain-containing protein n=1 Tax=Psychroflexus planctonicus TaxID=1526575 RepID=A0ABQ1SEZ5_9FLAO|nr:hypothetical protein [Psychroflexus planctonicus]GGE24005.1 hypothetical protein GCM10010832_00850 [Psychroflexus planctonicus]